MPDFSFKLKTTDGLARRGCVTTAWGKVETPAFMPVGTAATVKGMMPDSVESTGASIILANTYHLMLRPGAERVARLGGVRRMMGWNGPLLTDSGGFQVMSLGPLRKLDEDGVTFKSHLDGSKHRLTPERSTEIQHMLDATITMVFDECTPFQRLRLWRLTQCVFRCAGRDGRVMLLCRGVAMASLASSRVRSFLNCAPSLLLCFRRLILRVMPSVV